MSTLKKLFYLLSGNERKKIGLLLLMILLMAFLDMIGVASIMPFIAVLSNPDVVETNSLMNTMFKASAFFGVETKKQFLFSLGILIFILLVTSLTFKAITTYAQLRFTQMREYSIGKRLIEGYLNQPYSWFLDRNSAELGKSILSEVTSVVANGIKPMMTLISQTMIVFSLLILLIFIDPILAFSTIITISVAYLILYSFVRKYLKQIGLESVKADKLRFTYLNEAFGASKEIKLAGLEQFYINRFSKPAQSFAKIKSLAQIISQIPRFALEAIAFGGMLLVTLYLMKNIGTFEKILSVIAVYAFAGYRLMPALQQIYNSVTLLRFVGPALNNVYNDIKNLEKEIDIKPSNKINFRNKINLNNINYSYPNMSQNVLKDITLEITANKKIGIIGSTGSGKTTLVDIILGLLNAQQGSLKVDDKIINNDNRRSWQKSIGYVPQKIYLADDTIAANIAFGTDVSKISTERVIRAAKIANLHDFINGDLPLKYNTIVGERGVRLSGGQCQRIGIARALYNNSKVLILDEATSALDIKTEKNVMKALQNMEKEMTIIMIAHRLSTIKDCDKIFYLENGIIRAQGTYDFLIENNNEFKSLTVIH